MLLGVLKKKVTLKKQICTVIDCISISSASTTGQLAPPTALRRILFVPPIERLRVLTRSRMREPANDNECHKNYDNNNTESSAIQNQSQI